jgi:hypothetical protein
MLRGMENGIRYRGWIFGAADVAFIQEQIQANPGRSRRALSRDLCLAWGWLQPNGVPRDMVCRGLLLLLHRQGQIVLPARRCVPRNNIIHHRRTASAPVVPGDPIACALADVQPLTFRQVRRTPDEALVDSLIATYHYLGYTRPVGEHLKFLITAQDRPVACMAWSSAPRHLGPRDRFIGWSPEVRRAHIAGIAYNTRFLILPWVRVPHLASHILGHMARSLSTVWQDVYHHPIHLLETFVDPERYRGTCYRAANWLCLGRTLGLGKDARGTTPNRSLKEIWALPLATDFRHRLGVS